MVKINVGFSDVIDKYHRVEISGMIFFDDDSSFKEMLYNDACQKYGKEEVRADMNFLKARFEDGQDPHEVFVLPLKNATKQETEANTKTNTNEIPETKLINNYWSKIWKRN